MDYIIPSITIQQMMIFVTVVETKGFVHAASQLHMTQSAVSKSIARLEAELEFPLFIRSTRYLELTEAGKYLYEDWKIHLSALQNSYQQALRIGTKQSSGLRIGIMNTARPERYFYPVIKEFTEKYPDIDVDIHSQYMTDLVGGLEDGLFDLIVLPDFTRFYIEKRNLKWQYFAWDTARLIMSSHHPLAKRKSLKTKDLLGLKFVAVSTFTDEEEYLKDLEERLLPYGGKPEVAHIYKTAYDIRYLFRPDEAVLFVDSFFEYPEDASDFVILPVEDQKNGAICAWNPQNKNAFIHKLRDLLPAWELES